MRIREVMLMGGAYASAFIGVGVASGQEVMQYFTNHGSLSWPAIAVFSATSITVCMVIMGLARKDSRATTYKFYFGERAGWFFDRVLVPAVAFLLLGVLVAGAGSVTSGYYNIPPMVGVGVICLLILVVYLSGLQRIIDVLGVVGPILALTAVVLCVIAFGLGDGVLNADVKISANPEAMVIDDTWWWGAMQYAVFVPCLSLLFIGKLGESATSTKSAVVGAIVGNVLIIAAFVAMNAAFLSNYGDVARDDLPVMALATRINPSLGIILGVFVFAALFTTVMPIFWLVVNALPRPSHRPVNVLGAIGVAVVLMFSGLIPFGTAVNVIYPYVGLATSVIAFFIILGFIRYAAGRRKRLSPPIGISDRTSEH